MFTLVKLILGLCALILFVWFGANVPLGSRTLFQHLQAVGGTRETRDFLEGTRQTAQPIVDGVRKRLGKPIENTTAIDAGAPPADEIPQSDRERLKKMLGGPHPAR